MAFVPKPNRILAALEKGEVPLGMLIYTGDPSLVEILGYTGFDFFVLDMEHCRVNVETMEHCIRAADAAGITTVVRVAENNPTLIRHPLEAGAQGIIVPHVKNREDARKASNSVRYPPEGKCGICPIIRAARFATDCWDDYLAHSSKQTMLIPILEDKEAIDNVAEIFAELKPGVDAVWFGQADLVQGITLPGQKVDWNHPYLAEAYDRVLTVSRQTGIPIMAVPFPSITPQAAREALDNGARIILYAMEQGLFYNLCLDIVRQVKGK